MDWNKAFPETNFNFDDDDIRIEKTVKTLTKVCDKVMSMLLTGAKPFTRKFAVCFSTPFSLNVKLLNAFVQCSYSPCIIACVTLQSPEEIAKLTIDESLSDIDRAQLLITTGQEVQQICAINQLPRLLENHNVDAMCRVVPQLMVSTINVLSYRENCFCY